MVTPGPTWESVSNESTNSAMIRKIRHGSSLMNVILVLSFIKQVQDLTCDGSMRSRRAETFTDPVFDRDSLLRASEAFAAIQAFVAGAVSHRHMTALRTGRGILLKMGDRITQRFHFHSSSRWFGLMHLTIAVTVDFSFAVSICSGEIDHVSV